MGIRSKDAGPVVPTAAASVAVRPLAGSTISGGFWSERRSANRDNALPDGARQLSAAGNLANLERAAQGAPPLRRGQGIDPGAGGFGAASAGYHGPLFMDSDVYKWLEAAAWQQQDSPDGALASVQAELTAAVAAAQRSDGYLNSFVQIVTGQPWAQLEHSHELYCAGHLFQAAVASSRTAADPRLLDVAARFADLLTETFGAGLSHDVDGHPIVEMALVELFRETGRARYLELARFAVEARGCANVGTRGVDLVYTSNRVPVREATTLEGHAVRALYLAAGATDVAIETGDAELLAALEGQWQSVVAAKMYITGGMGSRWEGESFGDPFELPPDRAYAETCAAIASIQWSWRLLLATGRARYAELIERTLFNGMLAGVSRRGQEFFYANVLQLRPEAVPASSIDPALGRQPWFSTACCPPNVMRTLAQLPHYLATRDEAGIQIQQYAPGQLRAELAGGTLSLEVRTDYPYDGGVQVAVLSAPEGAASVSLRIPGWAEGATAGVAGETLAGAPGSYLEISREWRPGDTVELRLPMKARLTAADHRVDAVRGCVAVERGPLVYCIEQLDLAESDLAAGHTIDDVRLDSELFASSGAGERWDDGVPGGTLALSLPGLIAGRRETVRAIPYAAWANREVGPMRVWLPAG